MSTALIRRAPLIRADLPHGQLAGDDFIALLAHDIRSPLHTLGMSCDLLAQRVDPKDPLAAHQVQITQFTLRQLNRLVDDVLALYDRDGRAAAPAAACSVPSALSEAVADQRALAELHEVGIVVADPVPECWIAVERAGLLRILANLLTNAIRFTPAGGRIAVHCSCTSDAVRMSVEDMGPGLSPERLGAVYRGGTSQATAPRHRPLGLLIVTRLVAAFGGDIALEDAAGGGARFIVQFPRVS